MSIRFRLWSILAVILVFGIMATLGVIQMAQVAHLHKLNALHLRATLALNLAMQAPEFGPDRVAAVRDLL
ncbi:MAG: hypothetical protein AB7V26_06305, partial [Lysobacterales bacterium]